MHVDNGQNNTNNNSKIIPVISNYKECKTTATVIDEGAIKRKLITMHSQSARSGLM